MAASYPSSVKSFTTKLAGDVVQSAHVNEIQDEVAAVESDLVNGFTRLRVSANSVTLATDAITATKSQYSVDTEGAAASDNLSTITAGSGIGAGSLLILTPANVAHVVTVKDSVGNIKLNGGDFALDSAKKSLTLYYDGTNWIEVARAATAATATSDSKITGYTPTVADVVSTTSLTDTITWTNTAAVADGDEIEVRCLVEIKNNKGTSGTVTTTFTFGGVAQVYVGGAATWADNATARFKLLIYRFIRQGADMYVSLTSTVGSVDDLNTTTESTKITAPTFTAGQTGKISITLNASNAAFYWKTKSARVRQYT